MESQALFLSVKPVYARMILDGHKTVELRRVKPQVETGVPVVLYSTSPEMKVVGAAQIEKIETGTPEKIWRKVQAFAGVTKAEFDAYFEGAVQAVAIFLGSVEALSRPVELDALRKERPSFNPPQSYFFIYRFDPHSSYLWSLLDEWFEKNTPLPMSDS